MNFPEISLRLAPPGASLEVFSQLLFLLKRISQYGIARPEAPALRDFRKAKLLYRILAAIANSTFAYYNKTNL